MSEPHYRLGSDPHQQHPPILPRRRANMPLLKSQSRWEEVRLACLKGDLDGLEHLVKQGEDVNQTFEDGWSPLMVAANAANVNIVKYLLSQSADPNKCRNDGFSALMVALTSSKGRVLVQQCCQLLVDAGADVNCTSDDGLTPLLLATRENRVPVVDFLVFQGADVHAKDQQGRTASQIAAEKKYDKIFLSLKNNESVSPRTKPQQSSNSNNGKLVEPKPTGNDKPPEKPARKSNDKPPEESRETTTIPLKQSQPPQDIAHSVPSPGNLKPREVKKPDEVVPLDKHKKKDEIPGSQPALPQPPKAEKVIEKEGTRGPTPTEAVDKKPSPVKSEETPSRLDAPIVTSTSASRCEPKMEENRPQLPPPPSTINEPSSTPKPETLQKPKKTADGNLIIKVALGIGLIATVIGACYAAKMYSQKR